MKSLTSMNLNVEMPKLSSSNYFLILSAIVLSVVLISSLPAQSYALNTMFSGSSPKTTSRTYVNDEQGFQFEPPRGWVIKEDRSEGITLTLRDKDNTYLHVFAFELPSELDTMLNNNAKKKFEKTIMTFPSSLPGIEKTSTPKFTYYDDGAKVTFSVIGTTDPDGEKTPMKGQFTIWISQDNGKAYFMLYAADKYSYKTHLQDYKNVQKSFYVFPI